MITPSFSLTATERVLPRMALDFTTAALDPRVTFTRTDNTATVVNSSGFIAPINANLPRFDFDPTTLVCKGLLIEELRANLLLQSQALNDTGVWGATNATVAGNTTDTNAPDGAFTAEKLTDNVTSGVHRVSTAPTSFIAATNYAASVFVKAGTHNFIQLLLRDGGAADRYFTIVANLSTGIISQTGAGASGTLTSSSIVSYGNGWYRIQMVGSLSAVGAGAAQFQIGFAGAATGNTISSFGSIVYAGTGTTFYVWGAQLEAGAFATSYIPTVATSVTRNADVATMTGTNFSSWYNASEGTFVLNAITNVVGSPNFPRFFFVRGATTANSISAIQFRSAGSFGSNVTTGGVSQGDVSIGGLVVGSAFKGSIGYATNNVGVSFNGSAVSTDLTVTLPTVNTLDFSNVGGTSQSFSGYLIRFNYYPQRLTNAELQAFSR